MSKKTKGKGILKILLGLVAAVLVLAISAVLAMRFVILPKISQRLAEQGRGELAQIVDQNNNLGAFAMLGSFLSDRGVIDFLTHLDRESALSVIDLLNTIESEQAELLSPSTTDTPWQVDEQLSLPQSSPKPTASPTPTPEAENDAESAYERITAAATEKDMSDGLAIIAKLDMAYVASLVANGLTPSEKAELKSYVYSKLTKAEISRSLQLYNKYKKYL